MSGLLFVHAHPDDETIATGATMARYAAAGVPVTLVTCTRGEEGEVIPPRLIQLTDDRDGGLAPYRLAELDRAMAELGVADHRLLDELPGSASGAAKIRYRDSGMVGTPASQHPDAFAAADVGIAADRLARLVDELRPDVAVTYDPSGGYGHPDHIQAHRVLMAAVELATWTVPKLYWVAVPRSVAGESPGVTGAVIDEALVTTAIDGSAYLDRKTAALAAHATQVVVDGDTFVLSNGSRHLIAGTEYFRLVRGELTMPLAATGRETQLLA